MANNFLFGCCLPKTFFVCQQISLFAKDFSVWQTIHFVWQTITKTIDPAVQEMKSTIIRLTDQLRLLDQDMIRLQQKVNTVLELKEEHRLKEPDDEKLD